MVSSASGYDSEEEKRALVERLKKMEAEEEHDNLFDCPVPFGSGAPTDAAIRAATGKAATSEVCIGGDGDDNVDHFVYADPVEDLKREDTDPRIEADENSSASATETK